MHASDSRDVLCEACSEPFHGIASRRIHRTAEKIRRLPDGDPTKTRLDYTGLAPIGTRAKASGAAKLLEKSEKCFPKESCREK